jgi:hypothetical protein
MELFADLGAEVEELWRRTNYNEDDFPALAADALKRAELPAKVSPWEVAQWSLTQTELPRQRDPQGNFGDPPITVFSAPRFYIDIYFWFEGTTATHQHGFCGAFQVMDGSSIHSWYEFERRKKINAFCEIGEMRLKTCELLEKGDVQPILAGREYIHSLFHLNHPSVSIVLRTERSPLHLPQFSYHKPGLAIDPFYDEPTLTKKLQILSALFRGGRKDADEQVTKLLEASDLQSSYLILSQARGLLKNDHLGEMFTPGAADARFNGLLQTVAEIHGEAGTALADVFAFQARLDEIVRRRAIVTEPEHRFFMALLLNVTGREHIFILIRQRFPEAEPREKVLDWVFDLSQTRIAGSEGNALGIDGFGEAEMIALEHLLMGKNDVQTSEAYSAENGDIGAIRPAIAKVRSSVLFQALLS